MEGGQVSTVHNRDCVILSKSRASFVGFGLARFSPLAHVMLDAFLLGLYVCGKHLLHLMKSMAKVSQTDVGIYQDQQRNSVGFDTLSWTHILIGCRVLTNCSKAPGFGIGTKDFVAGIGQ